MLFVLLKKHVHKGLSISGVATQGHGGASAPPQIFHTTFKLMKKFYVYCLTSVFRELFY
jgi:hypothetical protein